jgi:hypothetical protein
MMILRCIGFESFREVFSRMDEHWCEDKFKTYLWSGRETNVGIAEFICSLDLSNMRILHRYLMNRMEGNMPTDNGDAA